MIPRRHSSEFLRRTQSGSNSGMATMEVVIATAIVIPSLFGLLYLGFRAMRAFLSLAGTMIGTPFL